MAFDNSRIDNLIRGLIFIFISRLRLSCINLKATSEGYGCHLDPRTAKIDYALPGADAPKIFCIRLRRGDEALFSPTGPCAPSATTLRKNKSNSVILIIYMYG